MSATLFFIDSQNNQEPGKRTYAAKTLISWSGFTRTIKIAIKIATKKPVAFSCL